MSLENEIEEGRGLRGSVFWNMPMAWCFSSWKLVPVFFFPSALEFVYEPAAPLGAAEHLIRCFCSFLVVHCVASMAVVT